MAVNDLEAVFGKPDDGGTFAMGGTRERSAKVTYWRRPDGWIARGPEVGTDPQRYQSFIENRKWLQLPGHRFGVEVAGAKGTKISPQKNYPRGQEHRWLEVFFDNGGLTYVMQQGDPFARGEDIGKYLMPASQLVSLGLHRRPEVVKLRPDLATAVDSPCPYGCIDEQTRRARVFGGVDEQEAVSSRNQHVVAVHREAVATKAMGDTISSAMQGVQGQTITPELIAQIAIAVAQAMKSTETAAVAAVAVEREELAEGLIVPNDHKDFLRSVLPEWPPISRQEIDSMSRGELMSWASKNKALFSNPPTNFLSGNRETWKRMFYEAFYPELVTS